MTNMEKFITKHMIFVVIYMWRITQMRILLWQARRFKEVTLIELAEKSGVSKSTLNNIENGRTIPNLYQLERIAMALNCKITDLFESEYK